MQHAYHGIWPSTRGRENVLQGCCQYQFLVCLHARGDDSQNSVLSNQYSSFHMTKEIYTQRKTYSRMESWASWCCDMVTKQRRRRNTEKSKNRTSADYQLGFIGKETYLYTRSQVKSACTPLVSPQTIRKRVNKQNQNLYRQSRKATSFSCKHTEARLMQASPSFIMCEASIISRLR